MNVAVFVIVMLSSTVVFGGVAEFFESKNRKASAICGIIAFMCIVGLFLSKSVYDNLKDDKLVVVKEKSSTTYNLDDCSFVFRVKHYSRYSDSYSDLVYSPSTTSTEFKTFVKSNKAHIIFCSVLDNKSGGIIYSSPLDVSWVNDSGIDGVYKVGKGLLDEVKKFKSITKRRVVKASEKCRIFVWDETETEFNE